MAKAIRTALPETHHRWCRWHVLKSAKKKMSKTYAKHKRFKSDFYNLVTYELSIKGFEGSWHSLCFLCWSWSWWLEWYERKILLAGW